MSNALSLPEPGPVPASRENTVSNAATNKPAARARAIRAAKLSDLDLVHERLMEAIETSPYYSPLFKQYEQARLTKGYLRNLIARDPHHVMIVVSGGQTAGFMISGPELGTLWLYWSYIFPEKRRATLALAALRSLIEHWDNGRFHKIATYTRPGNEAAIALMKRFKFKHVCTLEKHIFGEDYLHYERMLTKTVNGYDFGVGPGFVGRLKSRIAKLVGR